MQWLQFFPNFLPFNKCKYIILVWKQNVIWVSEQNETHSQDMQDLQKGNTELP